IGRRGSAPGRVPAQALTLLLVEKSKRSSESRTRTKLQIHNTTPHYVGVTLAGFSSVPKYSPGVPVGTGKGVLASALLSFHGSSAPGPVMGLAANVPPLVASIARSCCSVDRSPCHVLSLTTTTCQPSPVRSRRRKAADPDISQREFRITPPPPRPVAAAAVPAPGGGSAHSSNAIRTFRCSRTVVNVAASVQPPLPPLDPSCFPTELSRALKLAVSASDAVSVVDTGNGVKIRMGPCSPGRIPNPISSSTSTPTSTMNAPSHSNDPWVTVAPRSSGAAATTFTSATAATALLQAMRLPSHVRPDFTNAVASAATAPSSTCRTTLATCVAHGPNAA
ncbi:hypothetical protein VaNZ11_009934, partial [Volvox africanus]